MTIMSGISLKTKPSIKFFMFLNFSDGPKSTSSIKSHRNFEGEVVGLGIVAAMSEIEGSHEAFPYVKSSRAAAKPPLSVKSKPIPIISSKPPVASFRESSMEKVELMEKSESYTLVISHVGNGNSVRKGEYCFDVVSEGAIDGDFKGEAGVFFASPVKNTEAPRMCWSADFLSSCYLCRKKLHGLDIFMYRGDQAFCSVECRCKQILSDERKELDKCGSDALKPLDLLCVSLLSSYPLLSRSSGSLINSMLPTK